MAEPTASDREQVTRALGLDGHTRLSAESVNRIGRAARLLADQRTELTARHNSAYEALREQHRHELAAARAQAYAQGVETGVRNTLENEQTGQHPSGAREGAVYDFLQWLALQDDGRGISLVSFEEGHGGAIAEEHPPGELLARWLAETWP